jgi:ABC-type lipoprotein export system ATPase subunit/histidinol phosphatase-like PHP family hydrolase/broad-specificity NMP kinase
MNLNFTDLKAGAEFVRADLHIHSYGDHGSYDVTDVSMTPEAIVDTAIQQNLSIISITDHNEHRNVEAAIKHALGKDILVIPGVEISTIQGHLLIYFETYQQLKDFCGKLTISAKKDTCTHGIVDCLNIAKQFNGIGALAHIELTSGFEETIGRFGPPIEDVICHDCLYALEISNKTNINRYTDKDDSADRKRLLNLRRSKLSLSSDYEFPVLMSSDSHNLNKLGINALGEKKLTRIKMDGLSFHGFKVALQNSVSRIRLENMIPDRIPRFVGIEIEGGLLDKQRVHFSSNLTCIIGGRGAGKSTLLESLRETSGNNSISRVVDSEVWPEKINLLYEDETGRQITLTREKNAGVYNITDPTNGITNISIESYGQGETAETIQHSDQNPNVLLSFLDSFIELQPFKETEEDIRLQLIENQSNMGKLRLEVANIPETEKQKKNLEDKLEQLKNDRVGDLVKYQTALITERQIRAKVIEDLKTLIVKYQDLFKDNSVFKDFENLTDSNIIVGKDNFDAVKRIVSEFATIVSTKSDELHVTLSAKVAELKVQLQEWGSKEAVIQTKIDAKKVELEAKGIPFDLGKINQIANDVSYYQERLRKLLEKKEELNRLSKERIDLIKQRKEYKEKIFVYRNVFASRINDNLKNSVDGFFVNVKYDQGRYSNDFEEAIKNLMGWRTSQVPKARFLARAISPIDFSVGVRKQNLEALKLIIQDGSRIFSDSEITSIIEKVRINYGYEDFENLLFEDLPILTVTKIIEDGSGGKKTLMRNLSQLSLGQQQSILLAILIHSKSKCPLIIDQPEDNLDSEFIYKTIVSNLKKIKEKRQVIIVTHNANIAVLGDAELIVPLKSTSLRSLIVNSGSIDKHETRDLCCEILEGGEQAFKKRKEIYGF